MEDSCDSDQGSIFGGYSRGVVGSRSKLYAQSVALQQVWQSVSCACGERYVIHVLNAGMGGGVGDVLRVACS